LLLHRFLESRPSWKICEEAADGLEAVTKTEECKPDVVILDLAMPVMNGFQAAERLSRTCPNVLLLLISVQQVTRQVEQSARQAGFKGALTKANGGEVVAALEALLRGETFFLIDDSVQVV
jgi:DNA-binding NarL/FixJ family response regulator